MTLADFAAAAQLSCLDYVSDVPWDKYEAVKDWYAKIKSRPAFRSLLADQVPGFRPRRIMRTSTSERGRCPPRRRSGHGRAGAQGAAGRGGARPGLRRHGRLPPRRDP
jgi:hypothetical protein